MKLTKKRKEANLYHKYWRMVVVKGKKKIEKIPGE